ncbi:dihydroorotase [Celerinatantimonas diazotrophica]|uniref:Dihydroorotase n=1 Tax=Celerinatantimonas diazotrophica TaxID=412034 RepID=A0A4R1J7P5_9GAMM|nr:dihydroorotase [Celerinatantimonas diazotrophica]TCK46559.1 dihydroorotase [Celerinatantimonas diazotrophica]CAG9296609.1 Allantoinase [Celerinatantimonas diazotrophica]
MRQLLIKNATLINENKISSGDVRIQGERIEAIASELSARPGEQVLDAEGLHLLPGVIDDQVHFREPGLMHKGNIQSESRAAVAGGITSFMEMPNVNPQTTTLDELEAKYQRAAGRAYANHSFYLGATNDNLEVIKSLNPNAACGVKIFMGASTGNMLVDDEQVLANIFANSPVLIATHCENTPMIQALENEYRHRYGDNIPMELHAEIRSREACYDSSSQAIALAKKHNARLHVLHLTTAEELQQFPPITDLHDLAAATVTAEACVHHLWFNKDDYATKGSLIKCNPAIKLRSDQLALQQAVNDDRIAIIATDHAPHTLEEKDNSYFNAPSGMPLVQHMLPALLELYHQGIFTLERIVRKTSHSVAERYQIKDRGYLREGYFADLTLVNLNQPNTVATDNIMYHCNWSPFEGQTFQSAIQTTIVNGQIIYHQGEIKSDANGQRLSFNRL